MIRLIRIPSKRPSKESLEPFTVQGLLPLLNSGSEKIRWIRFEMAVVSGSTVTGTPLRLEKWELKEVKKWKLEERSYWGTPSGCPTLIAHQKVERGRWGL